MSADLKGSMVFVSYCTLAEVLIHYQKYLLPNQSPTFSTSMDNRLKFRGGNWPITPLTSLFIHCVMDLLSNWPTCLCILN